MDGPVVISGNSTLLAVQNPANPLTEKLLELLAFHVKPGSVIPRPTPFVITYAGPQPIGFVPPRFFGLPEDYFFGLTPEQVIDLATGESAKQGGIETAQLVALQSQFNNAVVIARNVANLSDAQLESFRQSYIGLNNVRLSRRCSRRGSLNR